MNIDLVRANALKLFCALVSGVVLLSTFVARGQVLKRAVALLVVACLREGVQELWGR